MSKKLGFSFYSLVSRIVKFVVDWKLCMAVDRDARQVIPDDLINCKKKGEKWSISNRTLSNVPQVDKNHHKDTDWMNGGCFHAQ